MTKMMYPITPAARRDPMTIKAIAHPANPVPVTTKEIGTLIE